MSWFKAVEYCNWLSDQEGLTHCYIPSEGNIYGQGMRLAPDYLELNGYRLPTEAEWEYACRAGTLTSWYHGESEALLGEYAWYQRNAGAHAQSIGRLKPNDLGLFDMLGNAMEWCGNGWWDPDYNVSPLPRDDVGYATTIGDQLDRRFQRGGSYFYQTNRTRSAARNMNPPSSTFDTLGFRIVRAVPAGTRGPVETARHPSE